MRIDVVPFIIVFVVLSLICIGTLVGLYLLYTRLVKYIEKLER